MKTLEEQVMAVASAMDGVAYSAFDGSVRLETIHGTVNGDKWRLTSFDEDGQEESSLVLRKAIAVLGRQLFYVEVADVEHYLLMELSPRALMGLLAY